MSKRCILLLVDRFDKLLVPLFMVLFKNSHCNVYQINRRIGMTSPFVWTVFCSFFFFVSISCFFFVSRFSSFLCSCQWHKDVKQRIEPQYIALTSLQAVW